MGLAGGAFGPWAPAMGAVAGLAIAACFLLTVRLEARHGARAGELSGAAGFDPDDALLVVPVVVWLGWSEWLLAAACLGAPLFLLYYLARFRGRLRGPAPLGEEGRSQG